MNSVPPPHAETEQGIKRKHAEIEKEDPVGEEGESDEDSSEEDSEEEESSTEEYGSEDDSSEEEYYSSDGDFDEITTTKTTTITESTTKKKGDKGHLIWLPNETKAQRDKRLRNFYAARCLANKRAKAKESALQSDSIQKEKKRPWQKDYANNEGYKATRLKYRAKNRDRIREWGRRADSKPERKRKKLEWRRANPERNKKYRQKYIAKKKIEDPEGYAAQRAKYREQLVQYKQQVRGLWTFLLSGAEQRHIPVEMTMEQYGTLLFRPCNYCGRDGCRGLDRVDSSLGYSLDNCVPCCVWCNMMKGRKTSDQFLKMCLHLVWVWSKGSRGQQHEEAFTRRGSVGLAGYKRGASDRGLDFLLTKNEFQSLVSQPCHYCATPAAKGIDRVDNDQGYIQGNVVPACITCNHAKKSTTVDEFRGQVDAIVRWVEEGVANETEIPAKYLTKEGVAKL